MSIPRNEGIRTARWKYIFYVDSQPRFEELYDLAADPLETVNLATRSEHTRQMEQFRQQLIHLRAAAK
jgi:arylsulfatase A-like enzyme